MRTNKDVCKAHQGNTANSALASAQPLYRGYSKSEYINKFPDDPLTFQMLYKDKGVATCKFIDSRFDGFQSSKRTDSPPDLKGSSNREIQINGILLRITPFIAKDITSAQKYISVKFNTDKYTCSKTGKTVNPMLYRRLPLLEEEINRQIGRILEGVYEVCPCPFIEIDSHL
jgi:hypothetical protein